MIIHHANKTGIYRGSSALKGAADLMLLVESQPDSSIVTFTAEKSRDVVIERFAATTHFELGKFHLSYADPLVKEPPLTSGEKYVLGYLEKHGSSRITEITDGADTCSPTTARKAIYKLAGKGLIRRVDSNGSTGRGNEAIYALARQENDDPF